MDVGGWVGVKPYVRCTALVCVCVGGGGYVCLCVACVYSHVFPASFTVTENLPHQHHARVSRTGEP